jgi:hypothetical protein
MPLKLHLTCSCLAAIVAALAVLWAMAATAAPAELQLLMFERDGCSYCRQWNEEIGPAYPKTAEGQAAPLLRLDIKAPLPSGVTLTGRAPIFTPTFVLLSEGTEVGRIEGYAGDEFFWVLLERLLSDAGWSAPVLSGGLPSNPARAEP